MLIALLQFVAVSSPMSLVCVTTPELPAGEAIEQWIWFGKALLLSASCVLATCLLQVLRKESWKEVLLFPLFSIYVSLSLMFWGGIEAIWGLRQLYGFSVSRHLHYSLTGSFLNPGPYGGFLAMILPICLHQYMCINEWKQAHILRKIGRLLAVVVSSLILCVLPASMSRSAWLAGAMGCVWVVYMHRDRVRWNYLWHKYKKRYIVCGLGLFFILMLGGYGMFLLKPDSALGRLFMWKITCQAIAKYPQGCDNGYAFAYGEAQENYFANTDYAGWEERVAGSPDYAFNEYLEFALTEGLVVCVMILMITLLCLRIGMKLGRFGICGGMIALLVFSFSSYPMHIPAFMIAYICLLLACGIGDVIGKLIVLITLIILCTGGYSGIWQQKKEAYRDWEHANGLYHLGAYGAANEAYKVLYPYLGDKAKYLYEYGHSLHKSGYYDESNVYLEKARQHSADPMILNIMGKNYQELECYELAENCFISAINRLPGRIYPYYLLAKLYAEPGFCDKEKFERMKQIVLTKGPKIHSKAIDEMRLELKELAKKLH